VVWSVPVLVAMTLGRAQSRHCEPEPAAAAGCRRRPVASRDVGAALSVASASDMQREQSIETSVGSASSSCVQAPAWIWLCSGGAGGGET